MIIAPRLARFPPFAGAAKLRPSLVYSRIHPISLQPQSHHQRMSTSPITLKTAERSGAPTSSTSIPPPSAKDAQQMASPETTAGQPKRSTASAAAADEALREAMEERSGGSIYASELEGGKQVGLKRGVKSNMFRYI